MANHKDIINFTKFWEGGTSSSQSDSARKNPSPCGNKNGYPIHTNKGIQWITFKSLASKGGYAATCDNFLKMPNEIWLKIYKVGFWDEMQGDKIKNQAIANTFVKWAWGSGTAGATSQLKKFFKEKYSKSFTSVSQMVSFVNELDSKDENRELFEGLMAFRERFLNSLSGQYAEANKKGWINREDAFYLYNVPYTLTKTQKTTAKVLFYGITTIAIGISIIYFGKRYGK
jgi:lysozyme family protein